MKVLVTNDNRTASRVRLVSELDFKPKISTEVGMPKFIK